MLCVLIRMSILNIQSLCRKIEKISLNCRYLLPELVPWLTLSGSNYPCLERISMVPKMFEPLRLDCIHKNARNNTSVKSILKTKENPET